MFDNVEKDLEKSNLIAITREGPDELLEFIDLCVAVIEDYPKAVSGVKKRATASRKSLMLIKKLATEMRKMALEKCNDAREREQGSSDQSA